MALAMGGRTAEHGQAQAHMTVTEGGRQCGGPNTVRDVGVWEPLYDKMTQIDPIGIVMSMKPQGSIMIDLQIIRFQAL